MTEWLLLVLGGRKTNKVKPSYSTEEKPIRAPYVAESNLRRDLSNAWIKVSISGSNAPSLPSEKNHSHKQNGPNHQHHWLIPIQTAESFLQNQTRSPLAQALGDIPAAPETWNHPLLFTLQPGLH